MSEWTGEQNRLLLDRGNLGAKGIQRALRLEFGVRRSISAIKAHASRIGASLERFEYCPECGLRVKELVRGVGLCPICAVAKRTEEHKRYHAYLTSEVEKMPEYQRRRREYDRLRYQNSMLRKGTDLPTKQQWESTVRPMDVTDSVTREEPR